MPPEPKRPRGRPPLPDEKKRIARFVMRTYQDVAEKAAQLGNKEIERLIRKAKNPNG